jgi:creatinine amidohydrolase/Fe(II)-dependent formamide hydrolase-like protein
MGNVKREAKLESTGLPNGIETPIDWQAYAVDLYIGDPRHATKEKGRILVDKMVEFLADAIRTIKNDTKVPQVLDEYYKKAYR